MNVNSHSRSLYVVVRPSICRLSVTFVHPTPLKFSAIFLTPFGTLDIYWLRDKILRRSSQGKPSVGGAKPKRGSQVILDLSNWLYLGNGARYEVSYYWWLIGSRIWAFDRYQNRWPWMTLNGVTSPNRTIISSNSDGLRKSGWRYTNTFCNGNGGQRM